MKTSELLKEINTTILKVYKKEDLIPLRGEKDNYLINGKKILKWYFDVTKHCECHYGFGKFNYFTNIDELLFTSDEIVYFTAHLYLYEPYVSTPIKNAYYAGHRIEKMIYPVFTNMEGKRYDMFLGVVFEKVYNFWDRIGDLIASFFPNKIKGNIYFHKTLKLIEIDYKGNSNFDWLMNFAKKEYTQFNTERINIVHHISKSISYKNELLENVSDFEKTKKLSDKRLSYPKYFKSMNEKCKIGFEKTIQLLEEINKRESYKCQEK